MKRLLFSNLKNLIVVILAVGGAAGTAEGRQKIDLGVPWAAKPISVDGLSSDWANLSPRLYPDREAVIGMANDSTRLYLLIRFRDPKWTRAIRMTGLTLDFKAGPDAKESFVLKYWGGPTPEQMREIMGKKFVDSADAEFPGGERPDRPGRHERRLFTCYIKNRLEEKDIPVDGSEGPAAAFNIDQGMYTYEFSIPLEKGGVLQYGLGVTTASQITLNATWGDMKNMPEREHRPDFTFGGMEGGPMGGDMGGAPPEGGMPGGPPGGMRRESIKKQEIQFKLTLAGEPNTPSN